jgi:hypothetical protein
MAAEDALRLKLTVTYSGQDNSYYYGTWGMPASRDSVGVA